MIITMRARQLAHSGKGRQIREAAGLSARELAGSIGVHPSTLRRWETDSASPSARLAKAWVTATDLLLREINANADDDDKIDRTRFIFVGKRLYVATPTSIWKFPRYFDYVESSVRDAFPDVELVFGAREFSNTPDWLARWDEVLASVDGLVFASDAERFIGMGVYKEIQDAQAAGLPVGYHVNGLQFCTLDAVEITIVEPENKVRYAKVKRLR